MSYVKRKEANQKRLMKRRARKDGGYAGQMVTAANRNELIEQFAESYYEMYQKQVENETKQIEDWDEIPEGFNRRFPILTEEQLADASIAYGKDICNRKNKELKAYIKGQSHYKWKGQVHPVMTLEYIMENERIQEANRKRQEEMEAARAEQMTQQIADKAGIDVDAEGVEFSVSKVGPYNPIKEDNERQSSEEE